MGDGGGVCVAGNTTRALLTRSLLLSNFQEPGSSAAASSSGEWQGDANELGEKQV